MASVLSSTEIASRQKYLDDLDEHINRCHNSISGMLDELGWTPDHFVQPRTRSTCPHNSGHRMPNNSLGKHTDICELVNKGCTKEEAEKILTDMSFVYQGCSCVYTEHIDIQKINAVLWNYHKKNNSVFYGYKEMPLTPNQEEAMLSREDRLGLADFIVNRAKEAKKLKEMGRDELLVSQNLADLVQRQDEARQLDYVEELAALRDYRRRRQSYRAKNVHITKKSHTEIVREVITNQMEMYEKQLSEQADEEGVSQRVKDNARTVQPNEQETIIRAPASYEPRMSDDLLTRAIIPDTSDKRHSRYRSPKTERSGRSRSQQRRDSKARSPDTDRWKRSRSRNRRNRSASQARRERSASQTRSRQDQEGGSGSRDRREKQKSPSRKRRSRSKDKGRERDRSRSRSKSSSRHKKHKHKKHKKHKHKHRGSDVEERTSKHKGYNPDDTDKEETESPVLDYFNP